MFQDEDEDDFFFSSRAASSSISAKPNSSLMGVFAKDYDSSEKDLNSLSYKPMTRSAQLKARKQQKKQKPATAPQQQVQQQQPQANQVKNIFAEGPLTVVAYDEGKVVGQMPNLGICLLDNSNKYSMICYELATQAPKVSVSFPFKLIVQPVTPESAIQYVSFYDDNQRYWSVAMNAQKVETLAMYVALCSHKASGDLTVQDSVVGGPGTEGVGIGDKVKIKYSVSLLHENHPAGGTGKLVGVVGKEKAKTIRIGDKTEMEGIEEGIMGMRKGGVRYLVIPSEQAYKEQSTELIPSYSTVIVELSLLNVKYKKSSSSSPAPVQSEQQEEQAPQQQQQTQQQSLETVTEETAEKEPRLTLRERAASLRERASSDAADHKAVRDRMLASGIISSNPMAGMAIPMKTNVIPVQQTEEYADTIEVKQEHVVEQQVQPQVIQQQVESQPIIQQQQQQQIVTSAAAVNIDMLEVETKLNQIYTYCHKLFALHTRQIDENALDSTLTGAQVLQFLNRVIGERDKYQSQVDETQGELKTLRAKYEKLRDRLDDVTEENSKLHKSNYAALEQGQGESRVLLDKLKASENALETLKNTHQTEKESMERKLNDTNIELINVKKELSARGEEITPGADNSEEIAVLETKIEKLKEELTSTKEELNNTKEELMTMEEDAYTRGREEAIQEAKKSIQGIKEKARDAFTTLKEQVEEAEADKEEILRQSKEHIAKLTAQLKEAQNNNTVVETVVAPAASIKKEQEEEQVAVEELAASIKEEQQEEQVAVEEPAAEPEVVEVKETVPVVEEETPEPEPVVETEAEPEVVEKKETIVVKDTKQCSICCRELTKSAFGKKQWKKSSGNTCKECASK